MIKNSPLLSAKNLSMTYKGSDKPALDQVSLVINPGQLIGLLGPNGAGKTTLISLLATMFPPSEGTLNFTDIDMINHPELVRQRIGYVPQDIALYEELTGRENLIYFATLYGLGRRKAKEQSDYYLEMFGLYDKCRSKIKTYSGGMKRRINLIIGLIHNPELLFLDEPTVGIDAQSRNLILEKLCLFNSEGMTIVYATHYMEEVEQICEKVIIIDEGQLICQGSPIELIKQTPDCTNLSELFFAKTGKALRDN